MTFQTRRLKEEVPERRPKFAWLWPAMAKTGVFLFGWYWTWRREQKEEEQERRIGRILRRILFILLGVLVVLALLGGTVGALFHFHVVTVRGILSAAGTDLPTDANGYTNFLLLGVGDKNHDGVDLTDTMIIASIDPKETKSAVLLSIPRDLYVTNTLHMGLVGRVNTLYRDYKLYLEKTMHISENEASQLSMKEVAAELGRQLGIQIHEVVKVDFTAFVDAVNTLGGVDIDVPHDIVDTQYPVTETEYGTFIIHAGLQHLDGETALKYARSRHSTSDFDRSQRQQAIIQAMGEKAKQLGIASPGKIAGLLRIFSDHVETTMNFAGLLGAAKLGDGIDKQNVISMHLNDQTGYDNNLAAPGGFLYNPPRDQYNGASVLLPYSIPLTPVTWKQLKIFVQLLLHNRGIYLAHPQIVILNAGAPNGLAGRLGAELTRFGFVVSNVSNASDDRKSPLRNLASSSIIAGTQADQTLAQFFATLLHLPLSAATGELPPDKLGQVTILLGKDYIYTPMQDLVPLAPDVSDNSSGSQ